ncbi:MAG: hypothetical protein AAGA85_09615 [Bacteroidota bacterium]
MKRSITMLILLLGALMAFAQSNPDYRAWKVLAEVDYKKSQDEYGEIFVPVFSPNIQDLEGTEVTLPGYIIPFEGLFNPDEVIVSSLPIASCFFCGAGGPETVAKAYLKEEIRYTAKTVKVTGRLELNDEDSNDLMFILRDAKVEVQ